MNAVPRFRRASVLVVAVSLAVPVVAPAVVLATLPAGNPEYLVQTDACESILDRSGELTLDGFTVVATDAGGGLSDVEVDATITNGDVGAFGRAAATPDFSATSLTIESVPVLEPMDFGDIAAHGSAPSTDSLRFRLPTSQVTALETALDDGSITFVVHAREKLVLRPDIYLVFWTADEDAKAMQTGVPIWTSQGEPPFGIGEVPDGVRVFVIVNEYQPVHITPNLWYAEYEDATYDSLGGKWDVDWGAFDPTTEDIDDVIVSGTFCGTSANDDPSETRPIRFNDVDLGPVSISGQVAGQFLTASSALSVRDGEGQWDLTIGMNVSYTAELVAEATAHVEESADLVDVCYPILTIPVGITAIQGAINVSHQVAASGDATAGMVVGYQKRMHGGYRMGFDSRRSAGDEFSSEHFWEPTPTAFTRPRLTDDTGLTLRASTGVEVGLAIGYTCPIDLVSIGAYARADIYGQLDVTPAADPWWTLSHGATLNAGLDFELLGFTLLDLQAPEVVLAGSETREGSGIPARGLGRTEGEQDRWALAVDDLGGTSSYADTAVAELDDGTVLAAGNQLLNAFAPDGQLAWSRKLKAGTNYQTESLMEVDGETVALGVSNLNNDAIFGFVDRDDGAAISATRYDVSTVAHGPTWKCALEDAITFVEDDQRGYLFVGRQSNGTIAYDICAVRLDAAGAVVWAKVYEDTGTQYAHAVTRTPDGGFAVVGTTGNGPASYTGNALLMKLESDGDLAWSKIIVTTTYRGDELYDVVVADDGTWWVTGNAAGTVLDDGGLYVATLPADGSTVDARIFYQDEAWEQDPDGGGFEPYVDTDGGNVPYDSGFAIALAPGGVVVAGRTSITSGISDPSAVWALKLGNDMGVEWYRTWDGAGDDVLHEMVATADGFVASGSSPSVRPLGTGGDHTLLVMKLAFEAGVEMLPGTGLVDRYIERADGGFPISSYNDEPYAMAIMDQPMTTVDGVVATVAVTDFISATLPSICVQLLTEPGNPSLTDGCTDDDDGDAVPASTDVCDSTFDPDQTDTDGDLSGDACDTDDDGDLVPDDSDGCPLVAEDRDAYQQADGCPEDGPIADACTAIPTIPGTVLGETLDGTPGNDVIFGYGGADIINGNGGHDIICAGGGDDTVRTGTGDDIVSGGNGIDDIRTSGGRDRVHGGPNTDTILGGNAGDYLWGDEGGDTIYGQQGDDIIRGGPAADTCSGGTGTNQLMSCP